MTALDDAAPQGASKGAFTFGALCRLINGFPAVLLHTCFYHHRHHSQFQICGGIVILIFALLSGCATLDSRQQQDVRRKTVEAGEGAAVRAMLRLTAERALANLSSPEAVSHQDSMIIRLPQTLAAVSYSLRSYGLGKHLEQLEERMNQAAAGANADMHEALLAAVDALVIEDGRALLDGEGAAATRYFSVRAADTLLEAYRPLVGAHLRETGFHSRYRLVLDLYSSMPGRRQVAVDLEVHVVQQGLVAILQRMANEERRIREAARDQEKLPVKVTPGR